MDNIPQYSIRTYAIFTVVVIIIYILCISHRFYLYNNYINGIWVADNKFCTNCNVDDMLCYMNTSSGICNIIINKDNNILENTEFTMTHDVQLSADNFNITSNKISYDILLTSKNKKSLFNKKKYTLVVSIANGKLVIYHNDVIYAVLFKDTLNTNLLD